MAKETYELSEMAVLGKILEDSSGDTMLNVVTQLHPDDFIDSRNRLIYEAFISMSQRQQAIDVANTITELINSKQIDVVGGEDYLNLILEKTNQVTPISNYIANIKDRSLLGRFLKTLSDIGEEAKEKPITDINDFIGRAENDILGVTKQRRIEDVSNMETITDELLADLVKTSEEFRKNNVKPNGVTGLPTGFEDIDRATHGWEKGDMIVIGARPSVGKTAFALNLLYQVARRGTPVIFFSLEMRALPIATRILSLVSNLSSDDIHSLSLLPGSTKNNIRLADASDKRKLAAVENLKKGLLELSELPFYLDRNQETSVLDIIAKVTKIKKQIPNLGLVAIDYLGLIQATNRKNENRESEVREISRQLKKMALTLEIPVIVLSQLNRQTESRDKKKRDHRPQMSDLRDSGAIEQDADKIFMLYRPDYYASGDEEDDDMLTQSKLNEASSQVEVSLQKNRNGPTGSFRFIFDKEHCNFSIVTESDPDEF